MRQTSKNVSPMSNEGRNLYVITHITESLLELLKDKPLNDISISELCSHAQVGRATFYRNRRLVYACVRFCTPVMRTGRRFGGRFYTLP